jgi:hypothetical protein
LKAIKECGGLLIETEMNDWSWAGWCCSVGLVSDGSMEERKKDEFGHAVLNYGLPASPQGNEIIAISFFIFSLGDFWFVDGWMLEFQGLHPSCRREPFGLDSLI